MPKKLTNPNKIRHGDWGHQLRGGVREGRIRIILQNMRGMGNKSDQPSQHKLDAIKKTMINEEIAIIGITGVNINWIIFRTRENIYNKTDSWF